MIIIVMNILLPTLQAPPVHPALQVHTPGDVHVPWRQDGEQSAADKIIIWKTGWRKLINDKITHAATKLKDIVMQYSYEATIEPFKNGQ